MKAFTCCFTGHRKLPSNMYQKIDEILKEEVIKLVKRGVRYFGVGGALGFDTLCALAILDIKKTEPQIKLILVLPCKNQDKYWSRQDKEIYRFIKASADKIVYVSKNYTKDCMIIRNCHLVDNSSYCICYLTNRSSGTAFTVRRAKEKGVITINIAKLLIDNNNGF